MTVIPPITDPMGRYWDQPLLNNILVDDVYAVMTISTLEKLYDYSESQPSSVYPGKMWRVKETRHKQVGDKHYRIYTGEWILCWFGKHEDPNLCSNNYRKILLID